MESDKKLISIKNLVTTFNVTSDKSLFAKKVSINAVDNISLDIYEGEIVGILGESGCGKSSLGRTILQLYKQASGSIVYNGCEIDSLYPKYYKKQIDNLTNNIIIARKGIAGKSEVREEFMDDILRIAGGLILSENVNLMGSLLQQKHTLNSELYRIKKRFSNKIKMSGYDDAELMSLDRRVSELDDRIADEKLRIKDMQKFSYYENKLSDGINLSNLNDEEMRYLRKDLQIVFQDPYSSLNQRMSIGENISQGLIAFNLFKKNSPELRDYVMYIMERCDLPNYMIYRYPYQFSEGQRQRVNIARAFALKPKFLVCDGVVSSLDVSIQSQIINLLLDLKEKEKLTYLFISHNINIVKYISDRIGIMYVGCLVELCKSQEMFKNPLHPYTRLLIDSNLSINNRSNNIQSIEGDTSNPFELHSGCRFNSRCRYCKKICKYIVPEMKEIEDGHFVACHLYE